MPDTLIDRCLESYAIANLRCEKEFVTRLVAALMAKRFVILTGLAGSGKTKGAQAFARWITPIYISTSDPFVPGAKIPSANITTLSKLLTTWLSNSGMIQMNQKRSKLFYPEP